MSILCGLFSFVSLGIASVIFFMKLSFVGNHNLVEVEGIVKEVKTEGLGRKQDLLIKLEDDELWYRSPLSYSSAFKYGTETVNHLKPDTLVSISIKEVDHSDEPRRHRLKGYLWKEFVSLHSSNDIHLAYEDHISWDRNNDRLARLSLPIMSILGLVLFVNGLIRLRKVN